METAVFAVAIFVLMFCYYVFMVGIRPLFARREK